MYIFLNERTSEMIIVLEVKLYQACACKMSIATLINIVV